MPALSGVQPWPRYMNLPVPSLSDLAMYARDPILCFFLLGRIVFWVRFAFLLEASGRTGRGCCSVQWIVQNVSTRTSLPR